MLADIGLIEPLRAQTVDDMTGLVGNPLLVHVLVGARQDAHHLAAARVDADRRADGIHDIDGLGLVQFPGPRREGAPIAAAGAVLAAGEHQRQKKSLPARWIFSVARRVF